MPAFEEAKQRALDLVDADLPVEAICSLAHALYYEKGLTLPEIAARLERLRDYPGNEGLRRWIRELP